jgi:hypothetical protein
MTNGQTKRCNNNHRTFQYHEGYFIVRQRAVETFPQLSDTVATSREDGERGDRNAW